MEAQWLADRTTLRTLLRTHPDWSVRDFAEAIGRSRGWVKKLSAHKRWVNWPGVGGPDVAANTDPSRR